MSRSKRKTKYSELLLLNQKSGIKDYGIENSEKYAKN